MRVIGVADFDASAFGKVMLDSVTNPVTDMSNVVAPVGETVYFRAGWSVE
jgi:hypothetical protein